MKEFKKENDRRFIRWEVERKEETKKWNKQWGELSNKMGSIIEDIISRTFR